MNKDHLRRDVLRATIHANKVERISTRRRKFVIAYLKNPDGKAAAMEAGYAERSAGQAASHLMHTPEVVSEIEDGMTKAAAAAGVSRTWVIENLKLVVERCMQAVPVLDKLGHETGIYQFNASAANRALELIGKHLRTFGEDEKNAAAQLGTAVLRVLCQEAQAARLAQPSAQPAIDHTSVLSTSDQAQERVPLVEGQKSLAPGRLGHPGGEPSIPVSPPASLP